MVALLHGVGAAVRQQSSDFLLSSRQIPGWQGDLKTEHAGLSEREILITERARTFALQQEVSALLEEMLAYQKDELLHRLYP
ncbi:hypothetical protein BTA51_23885 [Hahella sp. CCB-MM4]|nr:hypothetical protein BTA51_23885 [Hahella sp. CCB-MM4]